ncbi:hypothetical protein IT397_03550, partial [Candidatus Nomurabacteria bacterium]|nr:hypothetical protein [Candidatus Nomurabacteria bacterium]
MDHEDNLKKIFDSLPEDIRSAISSADTGEALRTIGVKYKLHFDKIDTLVDEVGLVLFGVNKSSELKENIRKSTGLDENTLNSLVKDIDDLIFSKIKKSLVNMESGENKVETVEIPVQNVKENIPDKNQILHEIENPIPTPSKKVESIPVNMIESKMNEIVR